MDRAQIEKIVRELLAQGGGSAPLAPPHGPAVDAECGCDTCRPRVVKPPHQRDPKELERLVGQTPARIVQGRSGTRYLTRVYVGLRAEHAIALDAVASEVSPEFVAKLGCIGLASRAKNKQDFLLHPELGRRLDDESRAKLEREASKGVDVQVIAADGLAAWAILKQGPELLPALLQALSAKGFSVGKPLFVSHARIGVQDEIGVLTQARSTVILVGERPGLGTGDSLSIYTAFKPRLGQDNAEKNCISNVRALGLPPAAAARECADLMRKTFDAGGGGLNLVRPTRDVPSRAGL